MDKSLEDYLLQAIRIEDIDTVSVILSKGANPNKIISDGMTCLGEAANKGNLDILKLLISASNSAHSAEKTTSDIYNRKRSFKCHKRKLTNDEQNVETNVKCKHLNGRIPKEQSECMKQDKNQGYFVFIHSEGSSGDESRITSMRSPRSPSSLTASPQADLEWDEDIGSVAPTTSEDERWSSMYKWYAAILESSGAAIAAASYITNGINQQDAFARTALHYAAENGHVGVVKVLLEAGCKVDVPASNGLTPLHVAVIKNYADIVRLLLEAGSNVNFKTHEKMSPLHFAATRGLLDLVKCLVKHGAHLEARDSSERTALYLAAGRGHVDVVKHLISCGANVNGEEIHGYTPLCKAVWEKYAPVAEVLLNSGARITHSHKLLHHSISYKQEGIIMLLLSHGGGINLHNDVGDTPLLMAVRTAQPKIAKLLLVKGANVNSTNNITGLNALHIAVENIDDADVFEELLKCLIEYNIDMNATALIGDTPLNRAILLHKDHAAVLLIRHGADVNACDLHSCGLDNLATSSRRKSHNLASMVLKAGHYNTISVDASVLEKPDCALKWLYHACRNPLHLSDICRIKIRRMCRSRNLFRYIRSLPLPGTMHRFLMMEDEGLLYTRKLWYGHHIKKESKSYIRRLHCGVTTVGILLSVVLSRTGGYTGVPALWLRRGSRIPSTTVARWPWLRSPGTDHSGAVVTEVVTRRSGQFSGRSRNESLVCEKRVLLQILPTYILFLITTIT